MNDVYFHVLTEIINMSCRYSKIVIWRLARDPLQNVNVQNDLLLDAVLTVVSALDKHRDMGRMFVWSEAIKKAGLRSNAIGLFFYQVIANV